MRKAEITVDVTGVAGLAEPLSTEATAYLPDACPASCPVVFAFPRGGCSRRSYDLSIGDDPDYSRARHHTDRDMVLVACDHLCTGEAAIPADPFAVSVEQLAEANAITADKLPTGTREPDVPPVSISASAGIGQSRGGYILTVHQGCPQTFDAVGFPFMPHQFRHCFHHDDVSAEVVDLDLGVGDGTGAIPAWRSSRLRLGDRPGGWVDAIVDPRSSVGVEWP